MQTSRLLTPALSAAALLLAAGGAQAQWVTFENITATNLVLQSVSLTDGEEKDMATGDFDQDGDTDNNDRRALKNLIRTGEPTDVQASR